MVVGKYACIKQFNELRGHEWFGQEHTPIYSYCKLFKSKDMFYQHLASHFLD
jgi:hypothetical protein